jgi:hypothetical protein
MKKHIYYLTLAIVALVFTSCTESDDEFFASTTVTSNELIAVNVTGNQLNISCYYPRLLPQAGGNPFDVYLTSTARKYFRKEKRKWCLAIYYTYNGFCSRR